MISSLPDWIAAGTALTAVLGGLAGVYTTTQSRMDVADVRIAHSAVLLEQVVIEQGKESRDITRLRERLSQEEISLAYLKEGQDRIYRELTRLNSTLTAK